ncbi:hypothetical protein [Marisediminitalea sp.]|uniref:hypothetical protein n=1 Tax=Marisediminitalea sp. TaxID=2662268 RepID=UPI0026868582
MTKPNLRSEQCITRHCPLRTKKRLCAYHCLWFLCGLILLVPQSLANGYWTFTHSPPSFQRNSEILDISDYRHELTSFCCERLARLFPELPVNRDESRRIVFNTNASYFYFVADCEIRFCNQFVSRFVESLKKALPVRFVDGKSYASGALTEQILCEGALKDCSGSEQLSSDEFSELPFELYISMFNVQQSPAGLEVVVAIGNVLEGFHIVDVFDSERISRRMINRNADRLADKIVYVSNVHAVSD